MNAVAFHTVRFAPNLRVKAHLTPEQAEGMAAAMSAVFASGIPAQNDIAEVRDDLDALRLSMNADIATSKSDLTTWMFGMIGFQTVAILGAAVSLVRSLH